MQDEHFIRQWNAGHSRFSANLDQVVAGIAGRARDWRRRIGRRPALAATAAHRAKLTSIGVIAGVLAGSSLAMVTPLVIGSPYPSEPAMIARTCVKPALV